MEREEETSRVQETEVTHAEDREGAALDWANEERNGSPTKTKTIQDDRITKDVIKETCFGECNGPSREDGALKVLGQEHHSKSDPLFPPGFEGWEGKRTGTEGVNVENPVTKEREREEGQVERQIGKAEKMWKERKGED
ncbi:hypothetical protein PIB30_058256 [Stylosanthes scabra]|uniref:Uncharacterized protein n=1 Tax=Stylosanthes scabra TaxID=79078 RepID=A0ABU6ZIQ7_9FABA|nr:hypothetical protein [Stylosanthes scabra]